METIDDAQSLSLTSSSSVTITHTPSSSSFSPAAPSSSIDILAVKSGEVVLDRKSSIRGDEEQDQDLGKAKAKATVEDEQLDEDGVGLQDNIVHFKGSNDPSSSLNFSVAKKISILIIVCFGALTVTSCSSMAPGSYRGVEAEFDISNEVAILSLSLFVLGLGLVPVVLSPMSEFFGRSIIYITGYSLFCIFNTMTAFSNNTSTSALSSPSPPSFTAASRCTDHSLRPNLAFAPAATFLLSRFLTGAAGSGFISVAGGTISDIFIPTEVANPSTLQSLLIFLSFFGNTDGRLLCRILQWPSLQLASSLDQE